MQSATTALSHTLQRLVPPSLRGGPEPERAWMAVGAFLATGSVALAFVLLRLAEGRETIRLLPLAASATTGISAFVAYWLFPRQHARVIRAFWIALAVLIPANTAFGDGLATASLPAVAVVPLSVLYLLGEEAGLWAALGVTFLLVCIAAGSMMNLFEFPEPAAPPDDELFGVAASIALVWMCWFVVTIYERRRQTTIRALRETERRLTLALRAEGAGVVEWRSGQTECFATPRLLELLGVRGGGETQPVAALFAPLAPHDADHLREAFAAAFALGDAFRVETELPGVGRPSRFLSWEGLAEAGIETRRRVVAIVRDVTEVRHVALLKDEFVAAVSHELRTPLTTIRGAVGLLEAGVGGSLDAEGHEVVALARRGAERLGSLVDDLLDVQHLELRRLPLNLVEASLPEVVARVLGAHAHMAQERGIQCRVVVAPGLPPLVTDVIRAEQVITHLVNNACKFTRPGSTVEVRIQPRGRALRVEIADQGPGIPLSFRPHLFEKFAQAFRGSTRLQGGAGVGLSIARALTERLGGRIGYTSTEGEGATFWVELPVAGPAVPAGG